MVKKVQHLNLVPTVCDNTFTKGITPKVNEIARLGFQLTYHDITVKHVNHNAVRLSLEYNVCQSMSLSLLLVMSLLVLQGSLNKFPDFSCTGTFIASTHMKL